MFEDYYNRLNQLQKSKTSFLKVKQKVAHRAKLQAQQNKYHKYILSQISHKNKLDSLFCLTGCLENIFRKIKRQVFVNLIDTHVKLSQQHNAQQSCKILPTHTTINTTNKQIPQNGLEPRNNVKKLCSYAIQKVLENKVDRNLRTSLNKIKINFNRLKSTQTIEFLMQQKLKQNQKRLFQILKNFTTKQRLKTQLSVPKEEKSFIFSLNEFSQIMPYTIQEESEQMSYSGSKNTKNIDQIDSKFKPFSQSRIQSVQTNPIQNDQYKLMLVSLQKLRQEVLMMKNLLCEKNKELKTKDQHICKLKKDYEQKIQQMHDELCARFEKQITVNSSVISKESLHRQNPLYTQQMEQAIIGERRAKNQGQQDPLHDQLLQKYMKQTFDMRQKMDMARQMCQQFQFNLHTEQGQIMGEIIRLLTPEERLDVMVD